MENEEWRDVPGYEGYYKVSNEGRILRLPRHKASDKRNTHNNIRKQKLTQNGYLRVNLSKDNETKWFSVHRLVAMTFIPNPNNLPVVNHKDENKQNNHVDNLEWCTPTYNVNYGSGIKRGVENRKANPNYQNSLKKIGVANGKRVRQFSPDGKFIAEYSSAMEASRATGVHDSQIRRHCKGKVGNDMNRPIRKFRFEYAEN